jgi:hypothetical protein
VAHCIVTLGAEFGNKQMSVLNGLGFHNVPFCGVNDMIIVSSQLPRERIIHWDDPRALAEAGRAMNGRDFLDAILRGALPSK